jgi:putative FmdB family regulatory protein
VSVLWLHRPEEAEGEVDVINDYRCKQCGIEFEYISVRSDDRPECPKCEAKEEELEKLLPKNTSFELKGAGWFNGGFNG